MSFKVVKHKNYEFVLYQNTLIPFEEPSKPILITKEEAKKLLIKTGAYFIRWCSDWDINKQTNFWFIIKSTQENLEDYNSNNRRKIRKGLKNCIVKQVTKQEIAEKGYEVYKNALKRYNEIVKITEREYKNEILNKTNYDFWGVYKVDDNKLIGYSQNKINENSVNYTTIKLHPNYLKLYSSYALFFKMNEYYLNKKKYSYVNDGARSLLHETNIQDFLEQKFKFRKAYCSLNVVFRPCIALILKFIYPFKQIIYSQNKTIFKKISVLLKHKDYSSN